MPDRVTSVDNTETESNSARTIDKRTYVPVYHSTHQLHRTWMSVVT